MHSHSNSDTSIFNIEIIINPSSYYVKMLYCFNSINYLIIINSNYQPKRVLDTKGV